MFTIKLIFSEDHVLAPRGYCTPKFLHTLENGQDLLMHTPPKTGISQQFFSKEVKKLAENLVYGLQQLWGKEALPHNPAKLCHMTYHKVGLKKVVQLFGGLCPLKFRRAKNIRNLAKFKTTFDFDREYLQNGSRYWQSQTNLIDSYPFWAEQKKIGELLSTKSKLIC